jgi:hypothetical protein
MASEEGVTHGLARLKLNGMAVGTGGAVNTYKAADPSQPPYRVNAC